MMRTILFWAMAPLVLPQGLYVRKTAPRFDEASGDREGIEGEGESLRLHGLGDSIIAGVGAGSMDQALSAQSARAIARLSSRAIHWTANGETGLDSTGLLADLPRRLPPDSVDYFVISMGVNDVTGLTLIKQWRRNLELLTAALLEHSPGARVAMCGLPPMKQFPLLPWPLRSLLGLRASTFDDVLEEVVQAHPQLVHVPLRIETGPEHFSPDGYHPTAESCARFGQTIGEYLVSG